MPTFVHDADLGVRPCSRGCFVTGDPEPKTVLVPTQHSIRLSSRNADLGRILLALLRKGIGLFIIDTLKTH